MKIPVLTYHAMNVIGNSYAENDHIALVSDLETISELGFEIIPLSQVVDWHQCSIAVEKGYRTIAITFDDGSWFDYYDLDHPTYGLQRSMINVLKDFKRRNQSSRPVHATSFVISSPQARTVLDKRCMIGKDWWGDQWWPHAASSGIMDIECHSWDHVHPELDQVAQQHQVKGDFRQIKSFSDCDIQFSKAGEYIHKVLGGGCDLLCLLILMAKSAITWSLSFCRKTFHGTISGRRLQLSQKQYLRPIMSGCCHDLCAGAIGKVHKGSKRF